MHLACLVDRDAQKGFEDGVFEAAKRFDNNFAFDFNGPLGAASFCPCRLGGLRIPMLLVDDLLLSPLLWVFREINEAVQQEKAGEAEAVTRSLSELYMKLETGAITEEEFAAEEKQLLDRLDDIERRNQGGDERGR